MTPKNVKRHQFLYRELKFHDRGHKITNGSFTLTNKDRGPHLIDNVEAEGVGAFLLRFLAWAWLAKAKGHSCHTKKSTLAKTFTKKKRVKVRSTPATTLQKKDPF